MKYGRRSFILLLTFYFLPLTFLSACGRRGDPSPITPKIEKPAAIEELRQKPEDTLKEEKKAEPEIIKSVAPSAPTGLIGISTQQGIILTWDEVMGQDITYKIYRSTGGEFTLAGEAVTPAFTDRDIKPERKYTYRVTAVGGAEEGPASKEIKMTTEPQ